MKLSDYSPITWVIERFFNTLRFLPPQCLMHFITDYRSKLSPIHVASEPQTSVRSKNVEYFVLAYVVVDLICFAATFHPGMWMATVAIVWACLRVIDIIQATVNVSLFDQFRRKSDNKVASKARLIVLGVLNYLELILCFAIVYATLAGNLIIVAEHFKATSAPWNALYFSLFTQLTISFGDITPNGWLRIVAAVQALLGLAFVVLIFARTVSALPAINEVLTPKESNDA